MVKGPTIFGVEELRWLARSAVHTNYYMREQKNAYNNWKCTVCGNVFRTRALLQIHRKDQHSEIKMTSSFTDLISYDCPFCGRHRDNVRRCAKSTHILHCSKNPDRVPKKGHKLSDEQKKLISENMKKAHAEGRAGTFPSRKKCEHSYPERWLISVLETHFNMKENIDYVTEFYFHKQFLDFAWVEKKLCIEIDGAQHKRFQDRIENDHKKDENLKNNGWKELRLDWTYVMHNTQEAIQKIKIFLGL